MNKLINAIIDNIKTNNLNIDDVLDNPENEIDLYYYAIRGSFGKDETEKEYMHAFLSINENDIKELVDGLEWYAMNN